MNCTKCGKEIPDGEKKVCDECERNVIESIVAEEKEECKTKKVKVKKEKAPKKEKNKKISIKEMVICGIAIVFVVAIVIGICAVINSNKSGNTIGNIRNYGYAVESDNWIYYLAPNEDSSQIGIFKIRNNGKDKKQLYMSEIDIVSLNVYKDHIYFIGNSTETYLENDELDNKIYRIENGSEKIKVSEKIKGFEVTVEDDKVSIEINIDEAKTITKRDNE